MRVLIAHHNLDFYGGAELVVARLARYLIEHGVSTTIAALSRPNANVRDFEGLDIITPAREVPYHMIAVGVSDYPKLVQKAVAMRSLVQREMCSYDLINVHNFPAPWSLFPKHKPCVWMCNEPPDLWHNPNPSIFARLGRQAALMVDRTIVRHSIGVGCVADESNAQRFRTRYGIEPRIIPYGIDHEFFARGNGTEMARRLNLDGNFVMLQVGQITPSKNQLASIRTLEHLRMEIKDIRLVLAGLTGSAYERQLREYIQENGLEQHVIFTGHLPREELRDLYHACDVALFPVHTQGSWLSPCEALSASKPVVVSTEMTYSGLLRDEKLAIVADDMSGVILDMYRNPEQCQAMARRGKEYVRANLGWDRFCQGMLDVFQDVLRVN